MDPVTSPVCGWTDKFLWSGNFYLPSSLLVTTSSFITSFEASDHTSGAGSQLAQQTSGYMWMFQLSTEWKWFNTCFGKKKKKRTKDKRIVWIIVWVTNEFSSSLKHLNFNYKTTIFQSKSNLAAYPFRSNAFDRTTGEDLEPRSFGGWSSSKGWNHVKPELSGVFFNKIEVFSLLFLKVLKTFLFGCRHLPFLTPSYHPFPHLHLLGSKFYVK